LLEPSFFQKKKTYLYVVGKKVLISLNQSSQKLTDFDLKKLKILSEEKHFDDLD